MASAYTPCQPAQTCVCTSSENNLDSSHELQPRKSATRCTTAQRIQTFCRESNKDSLNWKCEGSHKPVGT